MAYPLITLLNASIICGYYFWDMEDFGCFDDQMEKDGEIERLKMEVSELQKSNRQSMEYLEISEKNATMKSYLDKISRAFYRPSLLGMMAVKRSNCFHESEGKNPCHMNSNPYMIAFGVVEIIFSQIPDFDQLWWLSIVAAVMSFTYSTVGLGIAKVAENGLFRGSLTGITIGTITQSENIWRSFQALADIAFAYSYSMILIEIQDTIKSPPSEAKTMKKATLISVTVTTIFYIGCVINFIGVYHLQLSNFYFLQMI